MHIDQLLETGPCVGLVEFYTVMGWSQDDLDNVVQATRITILVVTRWDYIWTPIYSPTTSQKNTIFVKVDLVPERFSGRQTGWAR